jgi:hypothetical protein
MQQDKSIYIPKAALVLDTETYIQEFKYLGTRLTNKNSTQEEIKSRLKLWNACYYSVQNFYLLVCYPKS